MIEIILKPLCNHHVTTYVTTYRDTVTTVTTILVAILSFQWSISKNLQFLYSSYFQVVTVVSRRRLRLHKWLQGGYTTGYKEVS